MADRQSTTLIGSTTFVRGRVNGTGDLEIAGRIEGEVECTGDVLVDTSGIVGAGISARRIVVRGAVKGDLVGEEAVVLEAGARVVGHVLENGPDAIAQTKALVLQQAFGDLSDGAFTKLIESHAAKRQSPEAAEGIASFKEKRAARWTPGKS